MVGSLFLEIGTVEKNTLDRTDCDLNLTPESFFECIVLSVKIYTYHNYDNLVKSISITTY